MIWLYYNYYYYYYYYYYHSIEDSNQSMLHIQLQFLPHREHGVFALQSLVGECCMVNNRCLFLRMVVNA
jgi:hypothetical protein